MDPHGTLLALHLPGPTISWLQGASPPSELSGPAVVPVVPLRNWSLHHVSDSLCAFRWESFQSFCFIESNCQPKQNSVGADRWWLWMAMGHTLVFLLISTCPTIYWEAQKLRGTQNPRHYMTLSWRGSCASQIFFLQSLRLRQRAAMCPSAFFGPWVPRLFSRDLAESCATLWNLWTVTVDCWEICLEIWQLATLRTLKYISRNRSFMLLDIHVFKNKKNDLTAQVRTLQTTTYQSQNHPALAGLNLSLNL